MNDSKNRPYLKLVLNVFLSLLFCASLICGFLFFGQSAKNTRESLKSASQNINMEVGLNSDPNGAIKNVNIKVKKDDWSICSKCGKKIVFKEEDPNIVAARLGFSINLSYNEKSRDDFFSFIKSQAGKYDLRHRYIFCLECVLDAFYCNQCPKNLLFSQP